MKSFLYTMLALSTGFSIMAQKTNGNTLQFIASGQFYKIDDHGKVLAGPISVNGRVPDIYKTVEFKDESLQLYEVEGVEKLFEQKGDTLVDLVRAPTIMSSVKRNGKFGLIDMNGKLLVPAIYDKMYAFEFRGEWPTLLRVNKDGSVGLINLNGEVIVPLEYDEINQEQSSYIVVGKEMKKGLMTAQGKKLTELIYDDMGHFIDNKCWFRKNELYGFMNAAGKEIISARFESKPGDFTDGFCEFTGTARTSYGTAVGLIDTAGNVVIPAQYVSISKYKNCFVVNENYKYGLTTMNGKQLLPNIYESISVTEGTNCVVSARDANEHLYLLKNNELTVIDKAPEEPLTVEPILEVSTETVTKTTPENSYVPADRFTIQTIFGMISSITDSTGKVIWHEPIIYYAAENSGVVDSTLCELKDLEEVFFIGNDSDDGFQLPACFYETRSMKKIRILNSNYNNIPDAISNFKNLHYFETNSTLLNISPALGQLASLDTLILSTKKTLPATLVQLKKLKHLSSNHADVPAITSLESLQLNSTTVPNNMALLPSLKKLDLYLNPSYTKKQRELNRDSILSISVKKIALASSLETIFLDGSEMDWPKALYANAALVNAMPNLKKMGISYIGDDDMVLLKQTFPKVLIIRKEY
ncbi:MAG: WG repeat-containing protein [Bacteroidota bacterium]